QGRRRSKRRPDFERPLPESAARQPPEYPIGYAPQTRCLQDASLRDREWSRAGKMSLAIEATALHPAASLRGHVSESFPRVVVPKFQKAKMDCPPILDLATQQGSPHYFHLFEID